MSKENSTSEFWRHPLSLAARHLTSAFGGFTGGWITVHGRDARLQNNIVIQYRPFNCGASETGSPQAKITFGDSSRNCARLTHTGVLGPSMSFVRVIGVGNCLPDQFFSLQPCYGECAGCSEKVKADERGIFVGSWIFSRM